VILILGANGQIGRALNRLLDDAVALDRQQADLSEPRQLVKAIESFQPTAIINAAAYTAVDKAEEEQDLAMRINGESPSVLAGFCRRRGIPLVHYSSDYVYDGSGKEPRSETAPTGPLNAYGASKLAGDQAIEAEGGKYLIFRTSWVYDATGKNFLNTMLKLGMERERLQVVHDQVGAPSYAPHLAKASLEALEKAQAMKPFPSGIYHMCNADDTDWHNFALAIFDEAQKRGMKLKIRELEAIPTSKYPTPAKRPLNSRLDCSKLRQTFGITLPSWVQGLEEAMAQK